MSRLNRICFIIISGTREDIVSLLVSLYDGFAATIVRRLAARPRATARAVGNVGQDILLENVALKWTKTHSTLPSLEREVREKARVSGMAKGHPEKEKAVRVTLLVTTANA